MIKDAIDGKVDLIIAKSVSRFARNTVDTLTIVVTFYPGLRKNTKGIYQHFFWHTFPYSIAFDCIKNIFHIKYD